MSFTNEQMRAYQKDRYDRRMQEARAILGGVCITCGGTELLEIDHLEPGAKVANLSSMTNLSESRWREELAKCQLKCKKCHIDRTREQRAVPHGGGVKGRRNCPCEPCIVKRREYNRDLYARKVRDRPAR